mmetsp:Transcript_19719/g.35817  ORF Transcript_19719/g.35817 Transcript_19719/m.35817 type:complete len:90 (+) Transcript_19719:1562-1831(+)
MPRSIDIIARNEMVEKAKAGDKCVFTGQNNDVDGCSHHTGGCTHNARFSSWVDRLQCRGCTSKTCPVRRETIEIQRHYFQNESLFFERI